MKKDKKIHDTNSQMDNLSSSSKCDMGDDACCEKQNQNSEETTNQEIEAIKTQLMEKSKQCEEYFNMLQRSAAEFDNYKKRTAKEKETLYSEAVGDVILAFLPVVDNFERAIEASVSDDSNSSLKEGLGLVFKQLKDVMKGLGVEEIKCMEEKFDPQLHNAVMHVEDESYGESVVIEEFQKGYMLKDKVIRYSMVKVAN